MSKKKLSDFDMSEQLIMGILLDRALVYMMKISYINKAIEDGRLASTVRLDAMEERFTQLQVYYFESFCSLCKKSTKCKSIFECIYTA